eukprot:c9160_g1_i1.p1 GENE.c9160_g1_i1~~c9160_g1_i1.p1  ORF type:complete len:195 (+),score=51.85 c9160_g1_i1:50-634(+)
MSVVTKEMCASCFDAVHLQFDKNYPAYFQIETSQSYPLFVTWTKQGDLRGCIGTFTALELKTALAQYAITSAFNDSRFSPLKQNEISLLTCAVSLLHSFEDAQHSHDWEIGVHGITINFQVNGRNYSATYLPEVAHEQNWTKDECLESLMKKAGYRGKITPDIIQTSVSVTRYQSAKTSLSYSEYITMYEQVRQ